jgi:uncharacterized protein
MTQAAKAQEPSMEEILASIRRIIADDDASKSAKTPEPVPAAKQQAAVTAAPSRPAPPPAPAKTTAPPPAPKPAPVPASAASNSQDDIDAMLAELEDAPADEASTPDVLDLTEAMAAPSPSSPPPAAPSPRPAPGFRTIDGASDVVFTTKPEPPPLIDRGLISNETIAAVDSAFNTLAHTIIGQNARTLEDLVKEMLRPMLKSWLDDNLPSLVERIVRAEIERVSRGR